MVLKNTRTAPFIVMVWNISYLCLGQKNSCIKVLIICIPTYLVRQSQLLSVIYQFPLFLSLPCMVGAGLNLQKTCMYLYLSRTTVEYDKKYCLCINIRFK